MSTICVHIAVEPKKYCILLECANEPTHKETLSNNTVVNVCNDHRTKEKK